MFPSSPPARLPRGPWLILGAIILLVSAVFFTAYLRFLLNPDSGYNDFFVFWAAARYLQHAPLAGVYAQTNFDTFKLSLADGHFSRLPFLYPPYAAFLFAPFGLLPFRNSLLLWDTLTLAVYLFAVGSTLKPRGTMGAAALIAPATVVTLLAGQTGLLTSGLTLLGLGLLERRPVAAGILLGLLTLKPQLALLPCLVLLTAGQRRACSAAALTVVLLGAASALVFGVDAWSGWLHCLGGFAAGLGDSDSHQQFGVTVYFALLSLGLDRHLALAVQALGTLLVLWVVTRALRRGPTPIRAAMVAVGLYLATPYAVVYDLPAISATCLMLLAQGRTQASEPESCH